MKWEKWDICMKGQVGSHDKVKREWWWQKGSAAGLNAADKGWIKEKPKNKKKKKYIYIWHKKEMLGEDEKKEMFLKWRFHGCEDKTNEIKGSNTWMKSLLIVA